MTPRSRSGDSGRGVADRQGSKADTAAATAGLLPRIRSADDFAAAFVVSRETVADLESYVSLLKSWQKTINLVAPATLDEVWHRHVADSAQLLALAPSEARYWVDLGSGGGLPGLILAIMLKIRPGARMTLVESDARKVAFLREAARQTSAPVDILCTRIERAATHVRVDEVDVITARALAPLDRLLGLVRPIFGRRATALLPKGRDAESEIAEARRHWRFDGELVASRTDAGARIVVIRELQALSGG